MRASCLLAVLLLVACGGESPKAPAREVPGAQAGAGIRGIETTFGNAGNGAAGGVAVRPTVCVTARDQLELLLRSFAGASANTRSRFVDQVRTQRSDFERPLLAIVNATPPEPQEILAPAVEMVGWLRLERCELDLHRHLREGTPRVRGAAVAALHRLGYWTKDRLAAQLREADGTDPEVLCALLGVATLLNDPAAVEVVALLKHWDPRVREAAASAIPDHAGPEVVSALSAVAASGENGIRVDAIRLLGRLDATPPRDAGLAQGLQSADWSIRQACLLALANGTSTFEAAARSVWRRIDDPSSSVSERVHAFAVLEGRATVDVPRVLQSAARSHPVVRLMAARCLVCVGAQEGVAMLADLLTTQAGPGVNDEDRNCAREEAHRILSELAETDLGEEPEAWRQWQRKITDLPPRKLKTPARLSW